MKKTVIYCDRHDGEHPAVTTVWIRATGMGRTMRADVCEEAFRAIIGSASNGTPMLPPPTQETRSYKATNRKLGVGVQPGSDTAKMVAAVRVFLKNQRERFTVDDVLPAMLKLTLKGGTGKHYIIHQMGRVMRSFVEDGTLVRYGNCGVLGPKDAAVPRLATPAEQATAIAKCVRAKPGVRVAYLPGLLDLEPSIVKRTMKNLVGLGLVKTKGQRSSSRAYPVEQKK